MRGHIRKRGSKYSVVVDVGKDAQGRRRQKWYSGYKTKKEAETDLPNILIKIQTNGFIETTKLSTGEYLEKWYKTYCEPNLEKTTLQGYSIIIFKHLWLEIGKIPLQKLTALHINQYYAEALKTGRIDGKGGLSGKTLKQHHRVLREALKHAVRMQLISTNPADSVDSPRVKKFRAQVLRGSEEMKAFLKAVTGNELEMPIHLALGAGLRRSEVLGLRWKDVDFKEKTVTINQVLVTAKKELIFKQPKSETSQREIKVSDTLLELFKKHRAKTAAFQLMLGKDYHDNDLVVCKEDGTPIHPGTLSHKFSIFLADNKLNQIRFHDLRYPNLNKIQTF